jgi:predicted ribosome quality control (RQC) complex YloA/Tae2 family protein
MLSNYFTYYHIAQELDRICSGAVIAEVYSQEKNTLFITLYLPEPYTITISCAARKNFIIVREGSFRSKKNSVNLFPALIDAHLQSVYADAQDRIVYLRTTDDRLIVVEMFGASANVVLCDDGGIITDAFLAKKETIGKERTVQQAFRLLSAEQFLPSEEFFCSAFSTGETAFRTLKNILPKLGSVLSEEILFRAGVEKNSSSLPVEQSKRMYAETKSVLREVLQPTKRLKPVIYFQEATPAVFSLIPLKHRSSLSAKWYGDIVTALQQYLRFGASSDSFAHQKKIITQWLEREKTKTGKTLAAVEKELSASSRAEEYEQFGKILMSNLHAVSKGMNMVLLRNSFSQNESVMIPLDSALTPVQNAERYFDKAKRSKTARQETAEHRRELQHRLTMLADLLQHARDTVDSASLKNFLHLNKEKLRTAGYMTEREQKELPPFKIFTVDGGFTVYAGKSSENNDLLTMKFAKPNDLWFHARGSSGSHVVLKTGTGNGNPSKKAIEQAASIAAYYSKMKNATHVSVAVTEKKYVRKPKGAAPGSVVIQKEKIIFVRPELPKGI